VIVNPADDISLSRIINVPKRAIGDTTVQALAEAAARQLNLPCRPLLSRRETRQKTQASLGQQARAANLKDAFFPRENISFPVLLVDDVLTTGTTARRCAAALRSAGAVQITVLTFTRAVSGR
jgi:predicted amidophosphoribosyltransferase